MTMHADRNELLAGLFYRRDYCLDCGNRWLLRGIVLLAAALGNTLADMLKGGPT